MVDGFVVTTESRTSSNIEKTFDLAIVVPFETGEARPEGVEPPTHGFEVRYSIQLSYGRVPQSLSIYRCGNL